MCQVPPRSTKFGLPCFQCTVIILDKPLSPAFIICFLGQLFIFLQVFLFFFSFVVLTRPHVNLSLWVDDTHTHILVAMEQECHERYPQKPLKYRSSYHIAYIEGRYKNLSNSKPVPNDLQPGERSRTKTCLGSGGRGPSVKKEHMTKRNLGRRSKEFVLSEMHPLNDVATVVEYTSDIFSVYCTSEMRITIVAVVSTGCTYSLHETKMGKKENGLKTWIYKRKK